MLTEKLIKMEPGNVTSQIKNTIRVFLIEYYLMAREGLRLLVENHPEFEIVGEAGEHPQAIESAGRLQPDIILLELNPDNGLGLPIIPELLEATPQARILLVTSIQDATIHQQAIQKGVMGVVPKRESSKVLLKAIQKVHAGEVWIDRITMAKVLSQFSQARQTQQMDPEATRMALLSDREREVIHLIGEGLKNKEIASRLFISEITVRHHLTSIFNKLEVEDRLELTIYAYRNGLAELPA